MWTTPTGGWTSAASPLRTTWRVIASHWRVIWAVALGRRYAAVYVPYPAPLVVFLLSLLPPGRRPKRILLDGFVSIYDTVVNDRKLWRVRAWRSRLLRALERRAFSTADLVLVDTPQNADFYAELFRLPRRKFEPLALATNESDYACQPYRATKGRCRVLFIGTLVPLHGVTTIAGAARLLSGRPGIHFRFLGDGVDAAELRAGLFGVRNAVWQPRWHSAEELAQEIGEADICLGVFGVTDKTQRVCPYKLYAYASVGRSIITGDTEWLRSIEPADGSMPFRAVPVGDSQALADAILELADAPAERVRLARAAHDFYTAHLANAVSLCAFDELLGGWTAEGAP